MDYCFVDKNKDVWRFLAANMESLAESVKDNTDHKILEHFHEFLRGYTDIFTNKIYATKDNTYRNLAVLCSSDICSDIWSKWKMML